VPTTLAQQQAVHCGSTEGWGVLRNHPVLRQNSAVHQPSPWLALQQVSHQVFGSVGDLSLRSPVEVVGSV
jgi:hypothetical protein